jgi:general secretion pathway protein J
MTPRPRTPPRDAGYTLLEMLVALVVFGLVMAGIVQSFHFGLTAWTAARRNTARPEDLAAMTAAVTKMIAQAVPGTMTGAPDEIAFTTTLPPGAGLPGSLADVAILASARDGLVLRYRPHPPGVPLVPAPPPRFETLAPGITALTISYLVAQPDAAPGWSASWSGHGLPLLLKLHFHCASGRDWPDLVAAPVATGN